MEQDIRWKQRFQNYQKALLQLKTAIEQYADTDVDLIKEGIVQRFEFTHELAWKLLQDILKYQGFQDVYGSKTATRQAFNIGLISQGEIWLEMIEIRNLTVHTYDEELLDKAFNKIKNDYLPLFIQLNTKVEELCQNLD